MKNGVLKKGMKSAPLACFERVPRPLVTLRYPLEVWLTCPEVPLSTAKPTQYGCTTVDVYI